MEPAVPTQYRHSSHSTVTGWRWFVVIALGLAQLSISQYVWLPWMPRDKVLVYSSSWWVLWVLLVAFALLSSVPVDRMGLPWLRGLSAMVQGYIIGHTMVYDTSTLFARLAGAVFLGVANALDRIASMEEVTVAAEHTRVAVDAGATGTFKRNGVAYPVEVTSVVEYSRGAKVQLYYSDRPFRFYNYEKIGLDDVNLELTGHSAGTFEAIVDDVAKPGFQGRPWGYAFGVSLSQWVLASFTHADSFVAGMVTQSALLIISVPLTMVLLWVVFDKCDNDNIKFLCLCLLVACVGLEIVAFLPMGVGVFSFAAVQLVAHQVVAFVAIPVDVIVFFGIVRPSQDDLAMMGVTQMYCRLTQRLH